MRVLLRSTGSPLSASWLDLCPDAAEYRKLVAALDEATARVVVAWSDLTLSEAVREEERQTFLVTREAVEAKSVEIETWRRENVERIRDEAKGQAKVHGRRRAQARGQARSASPGASQITDSL